MPEATVAPSEEHTAEIWRICLVVGSIVLIILVMYVLYRGIKGLYDRFFGAQPVQTQAIQTQYLGNTSAELQSVPGQVQSQYNIVPITNAQNGSADAANNVAGSTPLGKIHLCPYKASDGSQLYCDDTGFLPNQPSNTDTTSYSQTNTRARIETVRSTSSNVNSGQIQSVSTDSSSQQPSLGQIHLCPYKASDGTLLYCDDTGFLPNQPSS